MGTVYVMKTLLRLVVGAAIAIGSTTAASAAVTVSANGTTVLSPGGSTTVNFDGYNSGSNIAGISSSLLLTFNNTSNAGATYNFSYTLTNTSTVNPSEVSAFGFNVSPDISGGSTVGAVLTGVGGSTFGGNGSISNGQTVEFCATSGNNCAGGQSSGVMFNNSTSGTFALNFSNAPGDIVLSNLLTRYQAFNVNGVGSGIGRPTIVRSPVPEPGTWAMMLLGFGVVGYSMRRRKRPVLAAAA